MSNLIRCDGCQKDVVQGPCAAKTRWWILSKLPDDDENWEDLPEHHFCNLFCLKDWTEKQLIGVKDMRIDVIS